MNPNDMTFADPQAAFEYAIARGYILPRFANDWMYMHTDPSGTHAFKHVDTRRYLYVPVAP